MVHKTSPLALVEESPPIILVVDGDDDLRESVVAWIEEHGFQTAAATNGAGALGRMSRGLRPALIVLDGRPVAAPAGTESLPLLRQDGEIWTLSHDGRKARLRDSKGLHYLAALLREPGRDLHVSDLIDQDGSGDAGELLDARAKAAYRRRLEQPEDALEDAEERGDSEGMARIQQEREALGDELARAVGLGGRDRKAGAAAERARINVQRRIRDVIARVAEIDEALGRHLERHLKTGIFCSWRP